MLCWAFELNAINMLLLIALVVTHFQVHPVTIIELEQNVNKHNISKIKQILGKLCEVYVTHVANADKGQ